MAEIIDLDEVKKRFARTDAQNWSNPQRLDDFILSLCELPGGPYGFIQRVHSRVDTDQEQDEKDLVYLCAMSQELLFDWLFRKAAQHPELAQKLTEFRDDLTRSNDDD